MVTIRRETARDVVAREALLDAGYGDARFTKVSERLREGRLPAAGLAFVACERRHIVGTIRLWNVSAGPAKPALLLGPLTVHPDCRGHGIGSALVRHAIDGARLLGHRAVLLVGDASFYDRFGFSNEKTAALRLPGGYDPARFLALELARGALDGACGLVSAAGPRTPKPRLSDLVARVTHNESVSLAAHAA
jgi:predicted N-acetyltransferase YhbS